MKDGKPSYQVPSHIVVGTEFIRYGLPKVNVLSTVKSVIALPGGMSEFEWFG